MGPRIQRLLFAALLMAAGLVLGAYALEADKEVSVLCGLFQPGTPQQEMDRILGTASFLRIKESRAEGILTRKVYSRVNAARNGCVVQLAEGRIQSLERWP